MRDKHNHIAKTPKHKEYYMKNLKNMDYEPTIDEAIKFQDTDDNERDFSIPKSSNARPLPFFDQLKNHFEKNWIGYVISIGCLVLIFLMFDSKKEFSRIDITINNVKEDVTELKVICKENSDKIHKTELELLDEKYRIKSIEEKQKK